MRAIANSGYREHTAPLFAKLGILDIFQVNALQIAKFMFYYHSYCLRCFLVCFLQVVKYKSYRPHHCRTNLKQFTILYQCPKIWNYLPILITGSTSFSFVKKKMIEFLMN